MQVCSLHTSVQNVLLPNSLILDETEIVPLTIHVYFALDAITQLTMRAMMSLFPLAQAPVAAATVAIRKLGRYR